MGRKIGEVFELDGVKYVQKGDDVEQPTYVIRSMDNFGKVRWLDEYMAGHRGFICGGCFKNILNGDVVKDIDIFFESPNDFQYAVDYYNDQSDWKFKYRNDKACAFQREGEKTWIELIESEFGTPEEILRSFDFTVTKMAYLKQKSDDDGIEYTLLHHVDFFEHLHQKRLVCDENIPFPVSTWERTYRYGKYGYNMCRETKKKLIESLKSIDLDSEPISMYNTGGWD